MSGAFLEACHGRPTPFTPIWLNRQAGRYLPEYRELKGNTRSLDFFTTPELAARATLDAQRILGVDAAIMFADLLPILVPMGFELDYVADVGPVIGNPVREVRDLDRIRVANAEAELAYVAETIKAIRSDLPRGVALIGFAGAPFTLASYAFEGRGSRHYENTKRFMYEHEQDWQTVLCRIVESVADYVELQLRAGVDAIQIFDSWVGCLSASDYLRYVQPATRRLFSEITGRAPVIYFGTGNFHLLNHMYDAGPDLMALDWRAPLVDAWDQLDCPAVQGNMDPLALCADERTLRAHADQILHSVDGRPGHIFNLGHGILPRTPADNVKRLVDYVHQESSRMASGL